jgi:hypothetical protein
MQPADPVRVIAFWKRVWGKHPVDERTPEAADRRLLCTQQDDSEHTFYQMRCISTDGQWDFYLLGSEADAQRVYPVIEYVLEHERQFP